MIRIFIATLCIYFTAATESYSSQVAIYHAAKRDIGTNPTGKRMLWCQDAVNLWLREAGYRSTGSRASRSILKHGTRIKKRSARTGDIVFRFRKSGGHTEVFAGWANKEKTAYFAITGNSCGKRGRRYVCKRKSSIGNMHRVIRMTKIVHKAKSKKIVQKRKINRKTSRNITLAHYTRNRRD